MTPIDYVELTRQARLVADLADTSIIELERNPGDEDTEKAAADMRADLDAVRGIVENAPKMLEALEAVLVPLIVLGDHIGNQYKGGNGLPAFDRCSIIAGVRAAIASAKGI